MSELIRVLGNAALSSASYVDVYEVAPLIGPDGAMGNIPQTVVGSIILCETAGSTATISVRVIPKGEGVGDSSHNILQVFPLTANQTRIISPGITLSTEDKIKAAAATGAANIFIFGSEYK